MIEVSGVTKIYGKHKALDDVSFTVTKGEILGFLGPNGAGKTTAMNIITGYLSAAGIVKIDGHDILSEPEAAKRAIGYLPDTPPLYGDMLVSEYLNFVCEIKGVKRAERREQLIKIMDTVKISDVSGRLIKNLSKGYKQRVGLAQAMIGFPDVLILDEPSNGLDPKQIMEMRDVIRQLGKKHTIILSSHILSEVSAVCDRVMIISRGKIVASDTPERLVSNISNNDRQILRVKGNKNKVAEVIKAIPSVKQVWFEPTREQGTVDITVQGEGDIREALFNACSRSGLTILMLKTMNPTLEEVFLQVTTGSDEKEGG